MGAVAGGVVCVIIAAVTSRLLSITSAMQLRVELRALEIMTTVKLLDVETHLIFQPLR